MKNKIHLRKQYFQYGIDYYIASRYSVFSSSWVVGNLFHHALEMLLKGFLSIKYDKKIFKSFNKKGHSITDAWKLFKQEVKDQTANQFDDIVIALDEFEDLRYPEKIIDSGAIIIIDPLDESNFTKNSQVHYHNKLSGRSEKIYRFNLASIDSLVTFILKKAEINPNSFINIFNKDQMIYLKKVNRSNV